MSTPPPSPHRPPSGIDMPTVGDSSIASVYAIRTPLDLPRVAALTPPRSLQPLGEWLLARGLVTAADLAEVLAMQRSATDRRIGWILKTLGILDDEMLGRALAAHLGAPCVYLGGYRAGAEYGHLLPGDFARENGMALLHDEPDTAWLAVADLTLRAPLEQVIQNLGKRVAMLMATHKDLISYLDRDQPINKAEDDAARAEREAQEERHRYLLSAGLPADSPIKHRD